MSEKHAPKQEKHASHESAEHKRHLDRLHHEEKKKAHEAGKHYRKDEALKHAREAATEHAEEAKRIHEDDSDNEAPNFNEYRLLKLEAYTETLKHVRAKLGKVSTGFSKFIHNQKIETLSEVTAKTVARPSAMLGGGMGAFVGSLVYLYTSSHYGFEYNNFMILALFVGGFFGGLIVEVLLKVVFRRR